ncbi:MAG: cupin domain-containing protein [Frankia sp.]|nr:cupin domain-containing protein [Frankia sp.]
MEIQPNQPTVHGPAEWFTGNVWIDTIAGGDGRLGVAAVHFTPGARSAWHSHSNGQTLYVTEGEGRVQSRGAAVVSIHAGDSVYTPADETHWHGAAPDRFMTHLSLTDGEASWGDHVTDDEYGTDPA